MLLTPRAYSQSKACRGQAEGRGRTELPWSVGSQSLEEARKMLLVHHQASVKVGEVFRYVCVYTSVARAYIFSHKHLLQALNICITTTTLLYPPAISSCSFLWYLTANYMT